MCASTGLGGGDGRALPFDLAPLSDPENQVRIDEWIRERDGNAKITGKLALNLNPIIRAGDGGRELLFAWWWLWLDNTGPAKFSAFNSRDDKLVRTWKKPFQTRALIPATWYIEKAGRFHLPGDEVFGIAALTNTITREDGTKLTTYSMVTRDAVGKAAEYWPRMPLVLPRNMHNEWLDPARPGDASLVTEIQLGSDEISHELTAS